MGRRARGKNDLDGGGDVTVERYWFNIATSRVETDADPGRRSDRMGPYRSRSEAQRALDSARLRTIAWEAADADSRARTPWTPPPPLPLTRFERWVLTHRGMFRALLFSAAGALLVLQVVAFVDGDGLIASTGSMLLLAYWASRGVGTVEQRARELEEYAAGQRP
jgi:hypothetical protein